ncbi:MAG: PAS domain S-box protein [FCB group bacterium]|nr:PAS domain S-box protein [FCB group bacterium]
MDSDKKSFFNRRPCGWHRVPFGAEDDPGFVDELLSINKSGTAVAGIIGIIGALLIILLPLLFGKQLSWHYGSDPAVEITVVWDKLLILLMGIACLIWSGRSGRLSTGRLLVALLLVAASVAATYDDIARGDISFSPAYLTLIMLVSVTIPYRVGQTLLLCLSISLSFVFQVYILHPDSLSALTPQKPIYLLLTTLICTGINALLYSGRYKQYRARKSAEELREHAAESEEKYRSLFDNATDAIFVLDNESGHFEMVNPMMENLLGIPAEELYRMQFHEIVAPEDVNRIAGYHIARMKGEAAPMQYKFKARTRLWSDPRICDMKLYTYDENERVTVGAVRDVTDQVVAEEKVRKFAAELESTNRELWETQAQLVQSAQLASLGNLVAGVAHELNTPLGAINSNTDVTSRAVKVIRSTLAENKADEATTERLNRTLITLEDLNRVTQSASDRIDVIVTALRNFARLDEAELKEVDIHEGIESALTILPREKTKRIKIEKDFAALPAIRCHPNQINQVFMNLLINAVEAIEIEGTVSVSTACEENWAVIRFADNGRGMSPQIQSRIYDPGFTTKGVGVGTGLGLAICYRIIESHKGQIDMVSEEGKGTEITVRLPID